MKEFRLPGISTGDGEIHDFSNSCFIPLCGADKPELSFKSRFLYPRIHTLALIQSSVC
jgi:hypothetical protein